MDHFTRRARCHSDCAAIHCAVAEYLDGCARPAQPIADRDRRAGPGRRHCGRCARGASVAALSPSCLGRGWHVRRGRPELGRVCDLRKLPAPADRSGHFSQRVPALQNLR